MDTYKNYLKGIHRKSVTDKVAISLGHEYLTVSHSATTLLTVPTGANYAFVVFEALDPSAFTDSSRVARITYDSSTPVLGATPPYPDANTVGLPVGHLDTFDINELDNLQMFRAIKNENAGTLYLHVYYYK